VDWWKQSSVQSGVLKSPLIGRRALVTFSAGNDVHISSGSHRYLNQCGDEVSQHLIHHRHTIFFECDRCSSILAIGRNRKMPVAPLPAVAFLALHYDFFTDGVDALLLFEV
jgi:hypothetical protein